MRIIKELAFGFKTQWLGLINKCLVVSLALIASGHAYADCISVDGSVLNVTGVLSKQTFPGPPNYESIENGDKAETHWLVSTDEEYCVNDSEKLISKFQLVFKLGVKFTPIEHAVHRVNGVTFMGLSGHHHTPILLEVSGLAYVR